MELGFGLRFGKKGYSGVPSVLASGVPGVYTGMLLPIVSERNGNIVISAVTSEGEQWIYEIDGATKEPINSVFLADSGVGANDHNAATHITTPSGRILTAWVNQQTVQEIYYKVADDVAGLASATLNTRTDMLDEPTYCQLFVVGEDIYWFIRTEMKDGLSRRGWAFSISTDDGDTWGGWHDVVADDGEACYLNPRISGTDFLFFSNRGSSSSSNAVRLARYDTLTGNLYTGDASDVETLLRNVLSSPDAPDDWADWSDIGISQGGDTYLAPYSFSPDSFVMASMDGTGVGVQSRYIFCKHVGGSIYSRTNWKKTTVIDTGPASQTLTMGRAEIALDTGLEYPRLYLGRIADDKYIIDQMDATNENGTVWQKTREDYSVSNADNHVAFRPVACKDTTGIIPYVWSEGRYPEYNTHTDMMIRWRKDGAAAQQTYAGPTIGYAAYLKTYGPDGSALTVDGSNGISRAYNIAGENGNVAEGLADFTSNSSPLRPINGGNINGNNAAQFLAGDLFNMEVFAQTSGQMFVVGKQNSKATTQTIAGTQSATNARVRWELVATSGQMRAMVGNTTHTFTFTNLPNVGEAFVAMLQWDGTDVTATLITESGTQTETQTQNGLPTSSVKFFIGAVNASGTPNVYFNGEMNHLVYYHSPLSGDDLTETLVYLTGEAGI